MSGDVQPRKRKDKKRKRDSLDRKLEGEIFSRKTSLQSTEEEDEGIHHGVHATKMGTDDIHLHVQSDHETGGHWCAKIFFFSLLAILIGLIGLIIMENRGLADLDTPLSESRFSEYFEGWVDENRDSHDHDPHDIIKEIEEHDEPFEEEEDVSAPEEEEEEIVKHREHDEVDDHDEGDDHDQDDDHDNDDEENQTVEDDDDVEEAEDEENDGDQDEENDTQEDNVTQEENATQEDNDDDENDEPSQPIYNRVRREAPSQEAKSETNVEDKTIEETKEENVEDDENDEDDNQEDDDDEIYDENIPKKKVPNINISKGLKVNISVSNENIEKIHKNIKKEEEDGTYGKVIENDAGEINLLREKARQAQRESGNDEPEEEEEQQPQSSSLAVKILVGFALAIVARIVLIKNGNVDDKAKIPGSKDGDQDISEDILMKRRLTVASPEMLDDDENVEELEEIIEEEIEEIEEVEEEHEEIQLKQNSKTKSEEPAYVPESFEQLNAMYKSKQQIPIETSPSLNVEKLGNDKIPMLPSELLHRNEDQNKTVESSNQEQKSQISPTEQSLHKTPIHYKDENYIEEQEDEAGELLDEEELYEEELGSEEEEVSEVDDDDLMKRLEEKYGKLPENSEMYDSEEEAIPIDNSWTNIKPRPGGGPQSFDTEDEFIEEQLRRANEHMLRDNIDTALKIYESLILKYPDSHGALLGKAEALDKLSETLKSNNKLKESIIAYKRYLAFGNDIPDDAQYRRVAERCIERMRFLGLISQAVIIHEGLIERFPNETKLRNNLAVTYLLSNQLKEAKSVLDNVLKLWPNDGFAKVHYGFILKNLDYDLENAVRYLIDGIDSNEDGTQDGRFYFHLGEALQRLNRSEEALEIFRKGAKRKLFPSEYQRSLYNVNNLRAKPLWLKKDFPTDYQEFFSMIERNWRQIREEGIDALKEKNYFINEAENLKNTGDWKQFELYSQGIKKLKNCEKTRVTCALIDTFAPARYCKRGQTKFSVMDAGTHVWPHCGPTNCRLRAHLGLKIPNGTKIRVAKTEKTWEEGKFLIFDDSFEHEVWHNGTSPRLILIVDIWHPDLSESQRKSLSPI